MTEKTRAVLRLIARLMVTVFSVVVDIVFYVLIFVAGAAIGFKACHYHLKTVTIPGEVMVVGDYVCKPNQGLKSVTIQDVMKRDSRYTFICRNKANFLSVHVVVSPDAGKPPSKLSLKLDTTPLAQTAGVSGSKISTKEKK